MSITSILKPQKYWINSTNIVNKINKNKRRISFDNIGSIKHYVRNGKLEEKVERNENVKLDIDAHEEKQQYNRQLETSFVNFLERKIVRNATYNNRLLKKHLEFEKILDLNSLTDIMINIKNELFIKEKITLLPSTAKIPSRYRKSFRFWLLKVAKSEEEASVRIQSVYRGIKARKLYGDKKVVNNVMEKLINDCILNTI